MLQIKTDTIRILGIAPFNSMKTGLEKAALQYNDIYFKCEVGDLEKGRDIAIKLEHEFDVIISRGGTALLIEEFVSIPVIDIELSFDDILRSIQLARNSHQKYAIVGFSLITSKANILKELMNWDIEIVTIINEDDADSKIEQLKQHGYRIIISDNIASIIANKKNLNSLLINSSKESIHDSFNKSIKVANKIKGYVKEINNLKQIIEDIPFEISSIKNNMNLLNDLNLESKKRGKFYCSNFKDNTFQYSVINSDYFIYRKIPNLNIDETSFVSLFSKTYFKDYLDQQLQNSTVNLSFEKSSINLLQRKSNFFILYGKSGTGKFKLLLKMIVNKPLDKNYAIINLKHIKTSELNYLLYSDESPFFNTNTTFIIKNLESIDSSQFASFIKCIENSSNFYNNFYITYDIEKDNFDKISSIDTSKFVTIYVKSLAERSEEILSLATMYLINANQMYGKNIVGFDEDSSTIIENYSWPGNLSQMKAVIEKTVSQSSGIYIDRTKLLPILTNDLYFNKNNLDLFKLNTELNFNLTLKEQMLIIIKKYMNFYEYNQTMVASKLDISRSTLWRYLK